MEREEISRRRAYDMSDEGGGHESFVIDDRPGSKLLKCYQHIGCKLRFNGAVLF